LFVLSFLFPLFVGHVSVFSWLIINFISKVFYVFAVLMFFLWSSFLFALQ
jgi:hypothetical protein